jgi:dihydrofolate synthase/folylpolyglutamate synthase
MELLPGENEGRPDVLIDGAHNPHAARALLSALEELFPGRAIVMIVAIMGDKDADGVLELLTQRVSTVIAVRCTERSLPPEKIVEMLAKYPSVKAVAAETIEQALSKAQALCMKNENNPLLLVTGSLYLAGKVRSMLLRE